MQFSSAAEDKDNALEAESAIPLHRAAKQPIERRVKKDGLDEPTAKTSGWTRVEDYIVALARRRTARHQREGRSIGRMDPKTQQPTLGTIPFLVMMAAFAVLFVAIAILAWPVHEQPRPPKAEREAGTAPPGWLENAEQEMNRPR
jgi:hypothetical protein